LNCSMSVLATIYTSKWSAVLRANQENDITLSPSEIGNV
jgi:hypothetical protein